jgi:hypothetical protein
MKYQIRGDVTIDKTKKKWANTQIDILWLIESKEYDGRYFMVDNKEWMGSIPFGSFIKVVNVELDDGGLWTVVGGVKALRRLL